MPVVREGARGMQSCDVLIVGAGIAGASAAYEIAPFAKVILLERESQPGYHTTGRSAALFAPAYGNRVIRALTAASQPFYREHAGGLVDHPVLTPRGVLFVGRADQRATLDLLQAETARGGPGPRAAGPGPDARARAGAGSRVRRRRAVRPDQHGPGRRRDPSGLPQGLPRARRRGRHRCRGERDRHRRRALAGRDPGRAVRGGGAGRRRRGLGRRAGDDGRHRAAGPRAQAPHRESCSSRRPCPTRRGRR